MRELSRAEVDELMKSYAKSELINNNNDLKAQAKAEFMLARKGRTNLADTFMRGFSPILRTS